MTKRLTGHAALRYAERTGEPLNCYANLMDDGGVVTLNAAREIVREEPWLIWADASQRLLGASNLESDKTWFRQNGDRALYTLRDWELVNSPLAELAKECGYASLRGFLNDVHGRRGTINSAIEALLTQSEDPTR